MSRALKLLATMYLLMSVTSFGQNVEIHFLDTKMGDAIIIDQGQYEIIIDGGRDENVLMEYIVSSGIVQSPVELLILTHADGDHWRGLEKLIDNKNLKIDRFWGPGFDRDDSCSTKSKFRKFIKKVERKLPNDGFHRPIGELHQPSTFTQRLESFSVDYFPGVTFQLLHASQNPTTEQARTKGLGDQCAYKINNASIVLMLTINGAKLLFTGDANGKLKEKDDKSQTKVIDVERQLLELNKSIPNLLKADLIKAPHHGSETASSQLFIEAVDPEYVIFQAMSFPKICWFCNDLPRPTVVERYVSQGSMIFRTDRNPEKNNDHIVCNLADDAKLSCSYKQ